MDVYLVQDTVTKKIGFKNCKIYRGWKNKNTNWDWSKTWINFVMEYKDRGTIADLIKKVKKILEKFDGLMTYQVLKGFAYCQKNKRIIHRDLKPSNILWIQKEK